MPHHEELMHARTREALLKAKGVDTEEVLLKHPDGLLFEGLSSNLFVLQGEVLYTAPLNLVLPGTISKIVRWLLSFIHCNLWEDD